MSYASLIQPVLWAIFGGACLVFAVRALQAWRNKKPFRTLLITAASLLFVALIIIPAIGVVPPGHRGIVYRWDGGIDPRERGEGVTLIAPWIQHINISSVRTQKLYSPKIYAQSSDLQEITVVASVNFHVEPDKAADLYQKVGPDYAQTVIQPALFQRTKAAVGQTKAEDFALEREHLARTIQRHLIAQLSGYGISVEYVNIEDAIFDPAFVAAVKNKIIAQQKAKEQTNLIAAQAAIKEQTIIKAQATARSVLIRAQAQAKANKKIASSVTGALLQWQWLVKWNGTLPSTLLGGSGNNNPALFLGIGGNPTPTGGSPYGPPG